MKTKFLVVLIAIISYLNVMAQTSIYDFKVQDRKGQEISLSQYRGKLILIVNTATKCGFTPQYEELENLYKNYKDKGLEILDFPCNQFGNQAPGSEDEIHSFCQLNYGTEFPQFRKVEVNGDNASPLFTFLKKQKGFEGFDLNHPIGKILHDMLSKNNPDYAQSADIKWNFTKFLVDKEGNVIYRFEPTHDIKDIERIISELI